MNPDKQTQYTSPEDLLGPGAVLEADDTLAAGQTQIPTFGATGFQQGKERPGRAVTETETLPFRSWGLELFSQSDTDLVRSLRPVPLAKHLFWALGLCHSENQYELITPVLRMLHEYSTHKQM